MQLSHVQRAKLRLGRVSELRMVKSDPGRSLLTAASMSSSGLPPNPHVMLLPLPRWRDFACVKPPHPPEGRQQKLFLSPHTPHPEHPKPTHVNPHHSHYFFVPRAPQRWETGNFYLCTQPLVQGSFSVDVSRLSGWSTKQITLPQRILENVCSIWWQLVGSQSVFKYHL